MIRSHKVTTRAGRGESAAQAEIFLFVDGKTPIAAERLAAFI